MSTVNPDPQGASRLADWLLAHGQTRVTTAEVAELLDVPAGHVRRRLHAPSRRGEWVSPARGLWIPVPPQYRTWGAPPGLDIVDALMDYLGRDYYVGWLSAAQLYGAAHQAPQVFQVAVDRHLADRVIGRTRFEFATRPGLDALPRVTRQVSTGEVWAASPELTVLDVCDDLARASGLSNAATVVVELVAEAHVSGDQLAEVAARFPAAAGRRVGWLCDQFADGASLDLGRLAECSATVSRTPSLLNPRRPARGPVDAKWNLRINDVVEPDL